MRRHRTSFSVITLDDAAEFGAAAYPNGMTNSTSLVGFSPAPKPGRFARRTPLGSRVDEVMPLIAHDPPEVCFIYLFSVFRELEATPIRVNGTG